ncbi:oxidoreductase FAD-binding protein [Apiospora rasikravindrae]|uniref:Oxidoreductase FAD-binding protein n=1 Tax=Apiospora rasikravindrae TaxID=990691 RepID=A0ABR1SE26_9PEZI
MSGPLCQSSCLALASVLGSGKIAFPDSSNYEASLASYYSAQQATVRPSCVVFPQTVREVSNAVKELAKEGPTAWFAIRSGGHTSWAGASNIAGGVTLDLSGLNTVDLAQDGTSVRVGTGATWDTVYQKLDPLGRTVAGGRVAGVGVGGLTLGGGVSHLSPQHGWTCDTVLNFQIVLSDGEVVEANSEENADLFFALRGGGSNFGIVTRIDLQTFEQGPVWSASLMCDTSVIDATIQEFVRLSAAKDYDEYASSLLSFAHIGSMPLSVIANTLLYTKAVENPPIYQNYMKIPSLQSSAGLKTMSAIAADTGAMVPKGARSLYRTLTLVSTEAVLRVAHDVWSDAVRAITHVPGITWVLSFDPLPPAFYARHAESNALGLTGRDGAALLVALLDVRWSNAADDELVASTAKSTMDNIGRAARALGAYDPFIYLNYAMPDQDPIATYGKKNVERLRAVRGRVDPVGMFTKQVPGGHKLGARE